MPHVRSSGAWSRAILLALLMLVLGPVARAEAQAPTIAIAGPSNNAVTNDPTPSFSGSTDDPLDEVTLSIYSGATAEGTPIQSLTAFPLLEEWSAGPAADLADGIYTVEATQTNLTSEAGASAPVTFTVDTVAPVVSLTPSAPRTNDATPSFGGEAGIASGDSETVKLQIYAGDTPVAGTQIDTVEVTRSGGTWAVGPVPSLADGTYTAQAEQSDAAGNVGLSAPSTFTIDTAPPAMTMTSPVQGAVTVGSSQLVEGVAGTDDGDSGLVTIKLFAGSSTGVQPRETVIVQAVGARWSTTLGGLSEGSYTVSSEQSDDVGNTAESGPVTFTVKPPEPVKATEPITVTKAPTTESSGPEPPATGVPAVTVPSQTPAPASEPAPAHSPPVASFTWFPAAPHTGQTVSIVSSSTDLSSPIATFAWAVADSPLQLGGTVFTTSFITAGTHRVSLRVVAADGLSSMATEEIPVSSTPVSLMQPFPIVRIAGTDTATGAKLTLLTVQAPAGARITVMCRGHGCPVKPVSRLAASSNGGVALIEFHHFERALRVGAVLEIRVSASGEIGKYTRFHIRRDKLPERTDRCLGPTGGQPISCPPT